MKKFLEVLSGAAFLFALGIVGAVEHSDNLALIWWMIPCFIVMGISAMVQDVERNRKFFSEVGIKTKG